MSLASRPSRVFLIPVFREIQLPVFRDDLIDSLILYHLEKTSYVLFRGGPRVSTESVCHMCRI